MKRSPVALVLVPVVLGLALPVFGRNTTDQDVARALRRALLARNLSDTAEIKVSSAVAAGKDVCIEYRAISSGQSISGQAVYRGDQDLVFLDNSWIWERSCLSGKYGQRRTGKDLAQALNAVLTEPRPAMVVAKSTTRIERAQPAAVASAAPMQPASLVVVTSPAVAPAPAPVQTVPQTVAVSAVPAAAARTMAPMPNPVPPPVAVAAVPRSTPVVTATSVVPAPPTAAPQPVIERAVAVAPVVAPSVRTEPEAAAARVVVSSPVPKPEPVSAPVVAVAMPAPATTPQPSVATISPVASPVIATAPVVAAVPQVAHVPAASAIPAVATVTQQAQIATASANRGASEVTPLHGVTIIDDNGALGSPTAVVPNSAPQESLADAARRARIKRSME